MGWLGGTWVNEQDKPTLLFRKCLGLNDAKAFGTQKMDVDTGEVEFTDCINLTVTDDGAVEKIPALTTALTHTAPISGISAGNRFMISDAVDTWEWLPGVSITNRFPLVSGPVCHTPNDVRITNGAKVYRSKDSAPTMQEALVGVDPNPDTPEAFYAMPVFKQAFVYGAKIYSINAAKPKYLQYSEDYLYDLYRLSTSHITSAQDVLQSGKIPGVLVTTHATGVTVYKGTDPETGFTPRFYPCAPYDNTLYSGQISKNVGYLHIFLAEDGIYSVTPEGVFQRLAESVDDITAFNAGYACSTVTDRKYLAFGNASCLEYDFKNKSVLKRSTLGISGACVFNDKTYFSTGSTVVTSSGITDSGDALACSFTLPYSDLSAPGTKSIEALYFTGTINGDVTITATDQEGESWSKDVSQEWVGVSNKRIKTPKRLLGNHISFKIECTAGAFRMEELRATFSASKRTR